jgi:hypothetical protein
MKKERVVELLQYSGTDGRKRGRAISTLQASLWKLRQVEASKVPLWFTRILCHVDVTSQAMS